MRRVIGMDVHRTFGEVVIWEYGLPRHEGRVELTRTALEGFGRQLLKTDEVPERHRDRQLVGTFVTETVRVPRARIETEEGKVSEWRSKALPSYRA